MSELKLRPHPDYPGVRGPLVLAILDGVGCFIGRRDDYPYNALDLARTPSLDELAATAPVHLRLAAHGLAVGMPSDGDQGNSEVGHNALGSGRVQAQGATLVRAAVKGPLFEGKVWQEIVGRLAGSARALHLMGLISDGNVHSHLDHVLALIQGAARDGIRTLYVHGLADGRDVGKRSAEQYFAPLEEALAARRERGLRYYVASGGGRMQVTMDRYEADWAIVERGWNAHVHGRCEDGLFPGAMEAILALRERYDLDDQNLPAWVVADPDRPEEPVGPIRDGDAVIFFNFRGDRALEISRAFEAEELPQFDRGRRPDVLFAGMTQYDGDAGIPERFLVDPPAIDRTVSEYLAAAGVRQYAVAETQKFGHVTYFWHGNNSGCLVRRGGALIRVSEPAPGDEVMEVQEEIPSDRLPSFAEAPAMKAREVTAAAVQAIRSGSYGFLRLNYANGDMVGHTGDLQASAAALEAVDQGLAELRRAVDEAGGTLVVTADHGNAEQMVQWSSATRRVKLESGQPAPMVSHSLNPVPFMIHGPDALRYHPTLYADRLGLGNVAATLLLLLGFQAPEGYLPSIIQVR